MTNFQDVALGDIVAIHAIDWAIQTEEVERDSDWGTSQAWIYGEVICATAAFVTVAAIVFAEDTVRCALSVPWGTVLGLRVLGRAEAHA